MHYEIKDILITRGTKKYLYNTVENGILTLIK